MALPQDGQNANTLTKVTEIPKGKELLFIDPTTNEGGIITLEDLTTQILKNLTSQTFALDQGNMTLLAALNQLNSKASKHFSTEEGKIVISPLHKKEGVLLLNVSKYNSPSVTGQNLYLVGYNTGNIECNLVKIYASEEQVSILSVAYDDNDITFTFGSKYVIVRLLNQSN